MLVLLTIFLCVNSMQSLKFLSEQVATIKHDNSFSLLLQEIMIKYFPPNKSVIIITDSIYQDLFDAIWYKKFKLLISYFMVHIEQAEDLLSPQKTIQQSLKIAKREGVYMYIILIANGLQVSRLLMFGDKYRVLDTRAHYVILSDNRLYDPSLFYIWKHIINVVFVKQYEKSRKSGVWFELTTVPFPAPINNVLVPRRLDIWAKSKFRKNTELFRDKTIDLKNQTLKVVTFPHLPATARSNETKSRNVGARMSNGTFFFAGTEVEILQTVSKTMNFRCEIYEPDSADEELWGRQVTGGSYTGIIGEMVKSNADVALGDLYYTPFLLDLMDLSIPYNTECLTFLTPEALTDNSWKTLILPFNGIMWASVLICLMICGLVFYLLGHFHKHITSLQEKLESPKPSNNTILTLCLHLDNNTKYSLMKEQYEQVKKEGQSIGLYQFSEPVNSILYTYSMLLLVSLPKLPTGWSLRMLTGWYWLYCLLLVVAYRASMTAILARPTPRVTINTLQELLESKLTYGGWGEINKQFFKLSLDPTTKTIGENFETVKDASKAVDRVSQASFAFYENTYFLKEALVKRQIRFQNNQKTNLTSNQTQEARDIAKEDRSLHIMNDCIINMPVSIGFQKNSPLKPRVDKFIRRVLEAGLVSKWLDDVMQSVLNAEIQTETESTIALMNMRKFFGALVALIIGYFCSFAMFLAELLWFKKEQAKPNFNKYSKSIQVCKLPKKGPLL